MKFSQIKTEEQQSLQTLETSRKFLDKELVAHILQYVYFASVTCWPFREAQQAHLSVYIGESRRSNLISQQQRATQ